MSKNFLQRYGEFAARNPEIVIAVTVIITVLMLVNALSIRIETDFNKFLPQDLEVVKNQNLLTEKFSEFSSLFLLAKLNTDFAGEMGSEINDIRNPRVMNDLQRLEEVLRENPDINSVFGAPDILVQAFGYIPEDEETIKSFFGESRELFGNDYSLTTLIVRVNRGLEEERLNRVVEKVEQDIKSVGFPGSLDLVVTGGPIINKVVFDLLFEDLIRTISIAIFLILIVLVVAYRSPVKGTISVTILITAVIWTGGTMELLGVPLSLITVTVGSLVVGIGIDYSIHIMNRYMEEKRNRRDEEHERCREEGVDLEDCMKNCFICYGVTVDRVGTAILGTAVTTIVSFMALAGSGIPFLTDLGIALSLGIFYSMVVALFVLPSLMAIDERITHSVKRMVK
jgi:hydrophobe/amphiphile efflux-3 (HAE3) family protein